MEFDHIQDKAQFAEKGRLLFADSINWGCSVKVIKPTNTTLEMTIQLIELARKVAQEVGLKDV